MGGKKTMEDSRRFEKDRRDKLNAAFEILCKLLPEYDPSVTLSKIEILKKAAEYIKHLHQMNDEVLKMGSDSAMKDECEKLKKRIANLLIKTKELVDALRTAGVTFPLKKNKAANQNRKAPEKQIEIGLNGKEGVQIVKCGCMKTQGEKMPLKEVNVTTTQMTKNADVLSESRNIITLTPVNIVPTVPVPTPPVTLATQKPSDQNSILSVCSSSTLVLTNIPPITTPVVKPSLPQTTQPSPVSTSNYTVSVPPVQSQPASLLSNNIVPVVNSVIPSNVGENILTVVTTASPSALPTQTTTVTNLTSITQNSIASSQIIAPVVQNVSVVDKNLVPNLVILADGRLVNVPQIIPQLVVKQPPAVILMPTAKKKNKLIMPKTQDVTKTTFANKAPISAVPPLRFDSSLKNLPKNKIIPKKKLVKHKASTSAEPQDPSKKIKLTNVSINTGIQSSCKDKVINETSVQNSSKECILNDKINVTTEIGKEREKSHQSSSAISTAGSDATASDVHDSGSPGNAALLLESENSMNNSKCTLQTQSDVCNAGESESQETSISTNQEDVFVLTNGNKEPDIGSRLSLEDLAQTNTTSTEILQPKDRGYLKDSESNELLTKAGVSSNHGDNVEMTNITSVNSSISIDDMANNVQEMASPNVTNSEKCKDLISNIPPCISSSSIQDSKFNSPTKDGTSLSAKPPETPFVSVSVTEHQVNNPTQDNNFVEKSGPSTDNQGLQVPLLESQDKNLAIASGSKSLEHESFGTVHSTKDTSNIDGVPVVINASNSSCVHSTSSSLPSSLECAQNTPVSENNTPNLSVTTPHLPATSFSLMTSLSSQPNAHKETDLPASIADNCLNSIPPKDSNRCFEENKLKKPHEFPQPKPPSMNNSLSQKPATTGSLESTAISEEPAISQKTCTSTDLINETSASTEPNVSNGNKGDQTSSFTNLDKSMACNSVPFINPINSSNNVTNNMYSSYPTFSSYSNENPFYSQDTFPLKYANTSSSTQCDKMDTFGNFNNLLTSELGDKSIFHNNTSVSQCSPSKPHQWGSSLYSKPYENSTTNTWDNQSKKQSSSVMRSESKSSEKENNTSNKSYLGYQDESPIPHSNNEFPHFPANPSTLSISCSYTETPSLFSYNHSFSAGTSNPYNKDTLHEKNSLTNPSHISDVRSNATIKCPHSVSQFSTNNQCNEVNTSLQPNVSVHSNFFQTNVSGSLSQISSKGCNSASIPSSVQNSSQASTPSFNYNATNQSDISSTFTSNYKASNIVPSGSSSRFHSKSSNNSRECSVSSNNITSSSEDPTISSKSNLNKSNASGFRNSNSSHVLNYGSMELASSGALNIPSSLTGSAMTSHPNQASEVTLQTSGPLESDSMNLFGNFPLMTPSSSSSNTQKAGTPSYSLSATQYKSPIASNKNSNRAKDSLYQPELSNIFTSTANAPSSLSQPSVVCTTSSSSYRTLTFTQAGGLGMYSNALQIDKSNLISTVSPTSIYCNPPTTSLPSSTTFPVNSSSFSSSSATSIALSQASISGVYTSSTQSDIPNVFSSFALPNVSNVQYKFPPLPNVSETLQNNYSAKSVQTNLNNLYSTSFQPDSVILSSLTSQLNVQTSVSHDNVSTAYSSVPSGIQKSCSDSACESTLYSRSQKDSSNAFANKTHGSNTSNFVSSSFTQPNDSSNTHNLCNPKTKETSYVTKNKICNSLSENKSSNSTKSALENEYTQLTQKQNKTSGVSNLNSLTCNISNINNNINNGSLRNQQQSSKADMNKVSGDEIAPADKDCIYSSNKSNLLNNQKTPIETSKATSKEIHSLSNKADAINQNSDQTSSNSQKPSQNSNNENVNLRSSKEGNSNNSRTSKTSPENASRCEEKTVENNSNSYRNNSVSIANSLSDHNSKNKSTSSNNSGLTYNCDVASSDNYPKSFPSAQVIPTKQVSTTYLPANYLNYNPPTYDAVSGQFSNTTLPLSSTDTSLVSTSTNTNSNQVYGDISKIAPLNNQSDSTGEKQKSIQKEYSLGNTIKGDMHLDLLRSKDLEKNTFIPIGYEDVRLPSDFSSDLFSSLQVPTGGQHSESISPTAAFLLAFPLVSTSRNVESLNETENNENQTSTPTTILQIGNIDPPTTELFHPMDFQKNSSKSTDQFDINNDYLQLPDYEKQNSNYKRCEKRKDTFSDYGKDVHSNKQKAKSSAAPTNTYNQPPYSNALMQCGEYQFCEKGNNNWQQQFTSNISKDPKKVCDRKKDKISQKNCYHQNYQDCFRDKKRKQQNHISVNWMSTPDNREQPEYQAKESDGILAPPAQAVFTGISLDFPSESFPDMTSAKKTNNYSWSPSKSLLPSLDSNLMIPSTLPTLVGDLALGTSTPSESYKTYETPKLTLHGSTPKKSPDKSDETKKRTDFPKSQANFFSVSQLVDPKSKKQKSNDKNYRRPDKSLKGKNNFVCSKRKEEQCMYYEEKNMFNSGGSQFQEKRNPYRGGSYSAESLISGQNPEMEFPTSFNYQQNVNYFPNEFSNNLEPSNHQYAYVQQTHSGSFGQEDCQDFGFGTRHRNLEAARQKSARKEDYMRDGAGLLPQISSCPPYSKSLNYNFPPPQTHSINNTNPTNTLTNFNLSTIFPEMNDQRVVTSGQPPQPINNQSFPNAQNYRGHLSQ